MSEEASGRETVGDVLAEEAGSRRQRPALARALRRLSAMDRAVYRSVAHTATPRLDRQLRRLSTSANHSVLWLGVAAALAATGGPRARRAALDGLLSIACTSATVNLVVKPLVDRRRPERPELGPHGRYVTMPGSASFPSGHSASAFAFAYATGRRLPVLAVPIGLLAAGVGYSRVHTGVHYPGDVLVGSALGAGTAAVVTAGVDALCARQGRCPGT